jgi:predicted nucleotidyltransferase
MVSVAAFAEGVLDEMTRRIVDRFQPERILLFGSRARGDFRPDSDYDLLVVLKNCGNRRRMAIDVRSELADLPAGKDILVAEAAEVEAGASRCPLIIRSALREGEVLYERQSSALMPPRLYPCDCFSRNSR